MKPSKEIYVSLYKSSFGMKCFDNKIVNFEVRYTRSFPILKWPSHIRNKNMVIVGPC